MIDKVKRSLFSQFGTALALLILMFFVVSIFNNDFLQWSNINGILMSVAPMAAVAIGSMVVLITGGIDFSAGNTVALAGVSAGILYDRFGGNIGVMVVVSLIVGICVGMFNGFLVVFAKFQPFIATLASMAIVEGMTLLISEGKQAFFTDDIINFIGLGSLLQILSFPFVIFLILAFLSQIILTKTKFGTYIYAIGGNEEATRYTGINTKLYKFGAYVFAGFCSGIGALLMVCRIGQIAPNMAGSVLLDAIASAVIGGVSLAGGKGRVSGVVVGVLIIGTISTALTFLNIPTTAQTAVKGMIILVALFIDAFFSKVTRQSVRS